MPDLGLLQTIRVTGVEGVGVGVGVVGERVVVVVGVDVGFVVVYEREGIDICMAEKSEGGEI